MRDPATGDAFVGVTRRRLDTDLARRVRARYRECVFPGCGLPNGDHRRTGPLGYTYATGDDPP